MLDEVVCVCVCACVCVCVCVCVGGWVSSGTQAQELATVRLCRFIRTYVCAGVWDQGILDVGDGCVGLSNAQKRIINAAVHSAVQIRHLRHAETGGGMCMYVCPCVCMCVCVCPSLSSAHFNQPPPHTHTSWFRSENWPSK